MSLARIGAIALWTVAVWATSATAVPAPPDRMLPDGLEHDFGKVPKDVQLSHTFRVVNTIGSPLRVVALRCS